MKAISSCLAPALLLQACSAFSAVQIYSNGNLVDPTPDTDLSHEWVGGFDLAWAEPLASSFILRSESLLNSVTLFTYDTNDGQAGVLEQVSYAIFGADSGPLGRPLAYTNGTILSSQWLPGHSCADGIGSDGHMHLGLGTIVTSFELATPLDLKADTKYWLVVAAVTSPYGPNDIAKWADSDLTGGFYLAVGGNQISGGRAFELYGEPTGSLLQPRLTMTGAGANVILTWPTNYTGFILQYTTRLGESPSWVTNLPTPVVINGMNTVTIPGSAPQQFFRLSQ
jgi:hypothetical protein